MLCGTPLFAMLFIPIKKNSPNDLAWQTLRLLWINDFLFPALWFGFKGFPPEPNTNVDPRIREETSGTIYGTLKHGRPNCSSHSKSA